MPVSIDIQIAGHSFSLFAKRGLFWPAQSMLFVADTHFGKEATFRHGGIPVPVGATDATLARITEMLRRTNAHRFCILGDMFHARSSIAPDVFDSVERFFAEFSDIETTLVRGNHDTRVGSLPQQWRIKIIEPGYLMERIALGHHPAAVPVGADLYLCGHLHPAIQVSSRAERLGKMPCFWYSHGQLVLPAIGEFTGTYTVRLSDGETAWIAADGEIFRYP